MGYLKHLRDNWKVAGRSLVACQVEMTLWHFVHGLLPTELTSHHRWKRTIAQTIVQTSSKRKRAR